jgi:hypothetical protein
LQNAGSYRRRSGGPKPWPELENIIEDDAALSAKYASIIGHRFKGGEDAIAQDPDIAASYLKTHKSEFKPIEGVPQRWPALEETLIQNIDSKRVQAKAVIYCAMVGYFPDEITQHLGGVMDKLIKAAKRNKTRNL